MIDLPRIAPVDIPSGTYTLPFGLVAIVADHDGPLPRGVSKGRCPLTKFMVCNCWACGGRPNPFIHTPPAGYP